MRRVPDVVLALLCAAVGGPPRHVHQPHPWNEITLEIESLATRPVSVRAVVSTGSPRAGRLEPPPHADSTTGRTPLSIPLDSGAKEIHVTTMHDEAVRVRIRSDGRELQQPSLAWGRDIRLCRVGDHYEVVAAAILITP